MDTPDIFIQQSINNTKDLFILHTLKSNMHPSKLAVMLIALEAFSIVDTSISTTHQGWSFNENIPNEIIIKAVKMFIPNIKCEVI